MIVVGWLLTLWLQKTQIHSASRKLTVTLACWKIGNVSKYCHAVTPRNSQPVLRNTKALLIRTMWQKTSLNNAKPVPRQPCSRLPPPLTSVGSDGLNGFVRHRPGDTGQETQGAHGSGGWPDTRVHQQNWSKSGTIYGHFPTLGSFSYHHHLIINHHGSN